MYWEIPQGSYLDIQGLRCYIPPPGYVFNIATKKLEKRQIHQRSDIPSEQYWERISLPTWYKDVVKREDAYEKKKKEDEPSFYDEKYEEYKRQEWDRRLNGFWYMNNGEPIYITGSHYMYMQWWQIDIGYPKFRIPDLEYFYFQQYCVEDPFCMGMLEITKRRFGKTYRGGLFVTEYPTRTKMTNGAIQSKGGGDAKKVFAKAVISPFKKLPKFFRPEYDMSLGITPKSEIRFQQTNIRGKKAEDGLDKEELGSAIDFGSADAVHYDGSKIHRYFGDEWAKTVETNVFERHEVVRYCLMDDEGNIIGKALYSSTVEQLETEKDGVQEAAIQLWEASNQDKKGEDGRTESGLYRFFMTADRARNFNLYGYPDVAKTVASILADRKTVENNQRSLAARIRKEARTIEEAFYAGNDKCEFNAGLLQAQLHKLEIVPVFLRKVRFFEEKKTIKAFLPGTKDKTETKVGWMDDNVGNWLLYEEPKEKNKFEVHNGIIAPKNTAVYCVGVDTFRIGHAEDGSEGTICVFKKSCVINGVETGNYPVAFYSGRPKLVQHLYDEVLKICMFYGCKVNFEISAGDFFYGYFHTKDCLDLLYWTPARDPHKRNLIAKPGTESASPFEMAAQLEVAKMYVDGNDPVFYNGYVDKIVFPEVLKQLMKYDHAMRTPYDLVISMMMALLPAYKIPENHASKEMKPRQLLPQYKIKIPA